jgi:hypothetical protein
MQKFLLPVAFVITSLSSCAQQSHLDKFYQKYHSTDGITFSAGTNISIDPSFLLNANFSGNSGGTDNNWMRKVTNLRLLILNGEKNPGAEQQWTELEGSLRQDGFEELITVRHGKDRFRLLSKEGQGDIKQIALLIAGKEGGGLFFHFKGHFTEKDMDLMRSALQEHDSQ